ncbi:IS66 family transposase [Candidatus Thiosymbion oneisti]|uniref:IS66 family transposase n=1 Tax=Candidatus Thiosymbion oneisti TaxID=589554 RepID=UPI00105D62A5|nr:transposase [Candidatus Thiosymbion oneisti]
MVEVVIQREVTEHRIVGGTCACRRVQRSTSPKGTTAPVQDGSNVSAFAVYMTQYQLLPYQRTAEVLNELASITIAPGTLQRAAQMATTHLAAPVVAIRGALVTAPVTYTGETGLQVDGTRHWLHVLSTAWLTAYFPYPKRSAEALDEFGRLAQLVGILVHDHWSAYERYPCLHAFCNAHHRRELTAIAEPIPSQRWATNMITLLCEANAQVREARAHGPRGIARCRQQAPADSLRHHPHHRRSL